MRRRNRVLLLAVIVLGAAVAGGGRFAGARGPDRAHHPAVGSWIVDSEPQRWALSIRTILLSADGTALSVSTSAAAEGTVGVGVWEPAGAVAAALTFTEVTDGPAYIVVRARVEVAPDGQSFEGTYTNEMVFDPAGGGTSGEIGPGTVAGRRMAAEAPGTPVASFEEFFGAPDGTPEATPAA